MPLIQLLLFGLEPANKMRVDLDNNACGFRAFGLRSGSLLVNRLGLDRSPTSHHSKTQFTFFSSFADPICVTRTCHRHSEGFSVCARARSVRHAPRLLHLGQVCALAQGLCHCRAAPVATYISRWQATLPFVLARRRRETHHVSRGELT